MTIILWLSLRPIRPKRSYWVAFVVTFAAYVAWTVFLNQMLQTGLTWRQYLERFILGAMIISPFVYLLLSVWKSERKQKK
jgi:hypothetical protein